MFYSRPGIRLLPVTKFSGIIPRVQLQRSSLITKRTVVTSTVDWKPIKTHHNPNEKDEKKGSLGKNIVLGLMIAMPVISFYLGTWQLKRLEWKTRLVAQCETKLMYKPIPLPKKFTVDMCEDWEYRKVKIRGHFQHDEEIFVGPRTKNGEKGYTLYTPFIREDTGEKILVERGWVSEHKVSPDERNLKHLSLPDKTIELVCLVRPPKERGQFQWEQDDKNSRLWNVADIYAMAEAIGCKPINFQALYDMKDHPSWLNKKDSNDSTTQNSSFLSSWKFWKKKNDNAKETSVKQKFSSSDDANALEFNEFQFIKAGVPIGKTPTLDLRNNHLQYLVTWYGLSALSTVFLVIALKKYWLGGVVSQSQLKKQKLRNAQKYM